MYFFDNEYNVSPFSTVCSPITCTWVTTLGFGIKFLPKTSLSISKLFSGFAFGTNNEIIIVSKFSNSFLMDEISETSKFSKANSGEFSFEFKVLKKVRLLF